MSIKVLHPPRKFLFRFLLNLSIMRHHPQYGTNDVQNAPLQLLAREKRELLHQRLFFLIPPQQLLAPRPILTNVVRDGVGFRHRETGRRLEGRDFAQRELGEEFGRFIGHAKLERGGGEF